VYPNGTTMQYYRVKRLELYFMCVFELLYAWYDMVRWLGRHAETGETLSANHVYPVGGVPFGTSLTLFALV
jgi:hypothetical protein